MKSKPNITVIGVGKLGLCFALNLEKAGFIVDGVDIDDKYVESLQSRQLTSSEPFVNEYLQKAKNIYFTTNTSYGLRNDILFLVVPTPSTKDWKYDHKHIEQVVEKLIELGPQDKRKDLIISSTTFPGYCDELQSRLEPLNYFVSYNPEFIAQGSIIYDQIHPDMILIGAADNHAKKIISDIYINLILSVSDLNFNFKEAIIKDFEDYRLKVMSPLEAEITKISLNCFLTTKIAYANFVGDLAIRSKCNPDTILNAIGSDSRIGNKYLKYGFGYGGPCFPRDNKALNRYAEQVGMKATIARATDSSNHNHLHNQILEFITKNPSKTKPVEINHVTFSDKSTSLEESQQLQYALILRRLGYKIKIKDIRPEVLQQLKGLL